MLRRISDLEPEGAKDLREAIAHADQRSRRQPVMMIEILPTRKATSTGWKTELDLIAKLGMQNYLQSQIKVTD